MPRDGAEAQGRRQDSVGERANQGVDFRGPVNK